jgi:hypothetical protein
MTSPTWAPPSEFRAQCEELYGLTCPPLWGTPRRPHFPTYGGRVAQIAAKLGTPLMPWQRYAADVALEVDPATGVFAYREVGLSVMRQQGKTALILPVTVHRLIAFTRFNVLYAAQTRNAARKKWEDDFVDSLDTSALAGKYRVRKTNGNEAIIWSKTRSRMGITSNTESAGHGETLDLGFIDEAFSQVDDRLEQAFNPAMLTRPMAQKWWMSAGGTEKSLYLNKKRTRGRAMIEKLWRTGEFPSVCYFEWFAPEHLDRGDPATWWGCMPALGHTVTEAVIRSELEQLDEVEFDRAYLNRTKKSLPPVDPNVPTKEWPGRADRGSQISGALALAIDVTPQRDHSSIAAAGYRDDGLVHVELIAHRPGTHWVVAELVRMRAEHGPVTIVVDSYGPAASLITAMKDAGITVAVKADEPQPGDLLIAQTRDVVAGCGQLADAVRQDTLRHIDQPQLNTALGGARTRPLGDAWAWARRTAEVDISPLVAVTLAKLGLQLRGHLYGRKPYNPLDNIF